MAKSGLEKQIEQAAGEFALQIVEAIKSATLQELIALQEGNLSQVKKRGRRAGSALKAKEEVVEKIDRRKNRIVKNYPKCAYPGCNQYSLNETCEDGVITYCGPDGMSTLSCADLGFSGCLAEENGKARCIP